MTRRSEQYNEHNFQTHDGAILCYRHWPAPNGPARGTIVLFHRGHEHGGRMAHLVDELDLPGFEFFAWDARGHGSSPGVRGFSPSFGASVRDVHCFMGHLAATHGAQPGSVYVVAQSVGAALVATWVHDYAPKIRGMSLASPAFDIKLYVPFARAGLALLYKLCGNFFVTSYVKAKFLTHDPERIASYESDPLIARPISVNVLLGLYDSAERVVSDAQAITVPTQLLISGADWVVRDRPQRRFFANLGSKVKSLVELPGFFHDTLGELDRKQALDPIRACILSSFAAPAEEVSARNAHLHGCTQTEAMLLAQPLSPISLRGLYWSLTRLSLKFGGLLSNGIRLGHDTGFDSGSTLDYVYRNRPDGVTPLGRLIDAVYLGSIGWRGIRQRKIHVEKLIGDAMRQVSQAGQPVRVMDIAAGHGRYVLDAVTNSPIKAESILLRDYSDTNVQQGTRLIAEKGLADCAAFVQANAFDRASIANVKPQPTVAVVSGLYELFPDNDAVLDSLLGVADAVAPGGFIVYTGQPWHPQLELIARALTSHRQGAAWVMRRRTQAEMDELVALAGFQKVDQLVDEWGIFTVSLARRP